MTAIIQMKPEGRYSNPDLERLIVELADVVKQKEVLHTKEVADFLGVSERTVYRMNELPSHKIPGLGKLYLRSELIEYIKKH